MKTIRMSSKGQVIIPKSLRLAHDWDTGQELVVINTSDGVLLKPKAPFEQTNITDVAGCLGYAGEPKSLTEMDAAVARGISEEFKRGRN